MAKGKQPTVRVIAGRFKGRNLVYPPDREFRPTMQRVKAAIFDAIQEPVSGAVFADLFAAAGGVGIEALSRGAAFAHFVERRRDCAAAIAANLERCGVDSTSYRVHVGDVREIVAAGALDDPPPGIVHADPPYDAGFDRDLLELFSGSGYDSLELVIVEHAPPADVEPPAGFETVKSRRFGGTVLTFLAPARRRS